MEMHGFHGNRLYDSLDWGGGGGEPTNSIKMNRHVKLPSMHIDNC